MKSPLEMRLGILLSLYVAQGLPTGVFSQALPALLRTYHVPLGMIGLSSLLALPWAVKVFWAPLVDRYYWPFMGASRSWILPIQVSCILLMLGLALFDPSGLVTESGMTVFFFALFLLNLLAATQDIATDSLAVRILAVDERSQGNAVQVAGYRLGLVIGGGLLLVLISDWRWPSAFVLMAFLMLLTTVPIAIYREPDREIAPSGEPPLAYKSVFLSFVSERGRWRWIWVLLTYKIADGLGSAMVKPMLVDMGLSLRQIGLQVSIVGSAATIAGAALGGLLTARWGRYPALMIFGVFQGCGLGAYGWLSWHWQVSHELVQSTAYLINAFEHLSSGMATVALLTVVMDYSRKSHPGSDFTLQVSLLAVFGGMAHLAAGFVAQKLGFTGYFLLSMVLAWCCLLPVVIWGRGLMHRIEPAVEI